jgi:hypothetical protein
MTPPTTPDGDDRSLAIEEITPLITAYGLLLLVLPIGLFVLFYGFGALFGDVRLLQLIILLTVFTIAHEGFHVIGWKYWGGLPWGAFTFGFKWEYLAPYAHAKAPMRADAYRLGALLPGLMTGLVPYVMALVAGDGTMTILSATMISGAVGDLFVVWTLRDVPPSAQVIDHPEKVGCIVLTDTDP